MEKLSVKQKEIYDFISEYQKSEGVCPALSDIADHLKVHISTADAHVKAMKNKGYLINNYRVPRSLRVVPKAALV